MTCSRNHDKSRLDSVLVCVDCVDADAREHEALRSLSVRLADTLAGIAMKGCYSKDDHDRDGVSECEWCGPISNAIAAAREAGLLGEGGRACSARKDELPTPDVGEGHGSDPPAAPLSDEECWRRYLLVDPKGESEAARSAGWKREAIDVTRRCIQASSHAEAVRVLRMDGWDEDHAAENARTLRRGGPAAPQPEPHHRCSLKHGDPYRQSREDLRALEKWARATERAEIAGLNSPDNPAAPSPTELKFGHEEFEKIRSLGDTVPDDPDEPTDAFVDTEPGPHHPQGMPMPPPAGWKPPVSHEGAPRLKEGPAPQVIFRRSEVEALLAGLRGRCSDMARDAQARFGSVSIAVANVPLWPIDAARK